jgi:putative ABC transport system permease protein
MVPFSYNGRNLLVRWKTTLMTASGFTLVTAAVVVMLAFVHGIQRVCATSGEPENVLVLAKGAHDEVLSSLDRHRVSQVEHTEGVASDSAGRPLASRELYLVVDYESPATGQHHFLQVRGVLPAAYEVHTRVQVVAGEPFRPSQSEVVVGRGLQRSLGLQPGDTLELGRKRWKVAGVFASGGSAFESEVWCDLAELAGQFRREGLCSCVVLRAADAQAAQGLAERLATSRTVSVQAQTEPAYYHKQAEQTQTLQKCAWAVAWFMGLAAVFGVMNTMFAAIGQRVKDIAVMRLMGYAAGDILISFLLEALLISVLGGALGLALGCALNGATRSASLGARQVDFTFQVDQPIVVAVAIFVVVMGTLGGLLPALSAMRIKPLAALR